jgi:hypothetical protein
MRLLNAMESSFKRDDLSKNRDRRKMKLFDLDQCIVMMFRTTRRLQ